MRISPPRISNSPLAFFRSLLPSSLAVALLVAGVDLASDVPLLAARFHQSTFYLEAAFISATFFFFVFLALASTLSVVGDALRANRLLSVFVAGAVVYWMRGYMQVGEWTSAGAFLELGVFVVGGAAGGWLAGRLESRSEPWRRFLDRVPVVVASSSAAVLLFFWFTEYAGRDWAKAQPVGVSIGWAALVLAVLFLSVRGLALSNSHKGVLALAALFLVSLTSRLFSEEFVVLNSQVVGAAEPKIKNVVLIVVDTLRADALRAYNPQAAPAGGFDQLASESFLFENAVAPASWTYPSMVSLMTGIRPYQVDAYSLGKLIAGESFSDLEATTLSGYMANAGYYARGILGNHLLYRPGLVASGLAEVETYSLPATGWSVGAKLARKISADRYLSGSSTSHLTDQALDFFQSHPDQPNFLWLHYFDPHDEYAPPKEFVEDQTIDRVWTFAEEVHGESEKDRSRAKVLYDSEVRWVGSSLERLFAGMKQLGIYEDSLIILTSDHGEEFWDHGGMYHGASLYQELLHVPLMVRLPGGHAGARISPVVPTRAILPTILDACGISIVDQDGDLAPSLLPLMESASSGSSEVEPAEAEPAGDSPADEEGPYNSPVISTGVLRGRHLSAVAVFLDRLKYISHASAEDDQLFDLAVDPDEQHNVISDAPPQLEEARAVAAAYRLWVDEFRERHGLDDVVEGDHPGTFQDRLKSLGYIQ